MLFRSMFKALFYPTDVDTVGTKQLRMAQF
jgi:hypothetical protein